MKSHEHYMKRALVLAEQGVGRTWPNPSVGCVLVKDGDVIGEARTQDGGRPHAEDAALRAAGERARGATAYVTLEPCAHEKEGGCCSQKLIDAEVAQVFVLCRDLDERTAGKGIQRLRDADIDVVEVEGEFHEAAKVINAGFFLKITENRPFICLKQAISADGMIASAPGQCTQISGDAAQLYLHELRATMDAVAVGCNTAIIDDPQLTVRLEDVDHPIVRVVFDSDLRLPTEAKLFQGTDRDPLWLLHKHGAAERTRTADGVRFIETGGCVRSAVTALAAQGITRLLVEGGATLHHSFIEAGLADEVQIIRSKNALGKNGVPGADFSLLELDLMEKRDLGQDLLEIYRPKL